MADFIKNIKVILKSLFYQGNWNTCNMQGTGFSWITRPFLPDLNKQDSEKLYEYFSTNPPFINIIAGIFIKEYKDAGSYSAFNAKSVYSSAFAALGDSFFWHALRCFLFLITIYLTLFVSVWFIILYPAVYTLFNLLFLVLGWFFGLKFGVYIINLFNKIYFNRWADLLDKISIFFIGVLLSKFIKSGGTDFRICFIGICMFILGYILKKYVRLTIFLWVILVLIVVSLGFYGGYERWLLPVV